MLNDDSVQLVIMCAAACLAVIAVCIAGATCNEQSEKTKRECYRAAGNAGQMWACQ